MKDIIFYLIIGVIVADYLFERYLNYLNDKHWSDDLPEELSDLYDKDQYKKSQEYHKAGEKLSLYSGILSISMSLLLIVFDGFYWIYEACEGYINDDILTPLMFFGVLGLGSFIIGIPFSHYSVFTIEEKFGFNKMNLKTFITDKIKGILLSIVIGGSLLTAFIYFYQAFPEHFWLYGWIVFTSFSLLMAAFYVDLIVPIFNKLSPLEDQELFEKIKKLAKSTNFPLSNISVIDGSKRSSKANAYFSGIGFKKSIVLFDTLIEEHSPEELLAILAHEIGHYKKKHILWSFGLSAINMFITLFIMAWFIKTPELSQALGAPGVNFAIGLIAFSLIYSPVSTLTSIAMNMLSRRFEYQADAYAKEYSSADDLISSLKRLSVKHLSNLRPHPSYVFVHYSHPTLLQRIKALTKDNN